MLGCTLVISQLGGYILECPVYVFLMLSMS